MSNSEDSTVTYTQISNPFADLSDIGSPGVDGPPIMPDDPYAYVVAAFQAPPSPDYVPGPEEPQAPLPLDFVPEPFNLKFMPPDDESDPEEDPEEDDEDPEEDPADYLADRDDDDDKEEEEVERLLALTTPPPSPLTPLSSPLPQIPSPPLLPIPAPISSPLVLLPPTDRRADRPEVCLPPSKIILLLCSTQGPRYEVGESSSAAAARPTGGRRADYGPEKAIEEEPRRPCKGVNIGRPSLLRSEQDHTDIYAGWRGSQGQQAVTSQLQAADRRSQTVTSEMLQAYHMRQAEIVALRTFDRIRQEQLKMAPKRKTRSTPETTTTTTSVTNAQLQAMIDQGVTGWHYTREMQLGMAMTAILMNVVSRVTKRIARECNLKTS
ncbi:hypothetical protein Tco_0524245 [Tanacetum coccineum]